MNPSERKAIVAAAHGTVTAMARKLGVTQQIVHKTIYSGRSGTPKVVAELRRLGVEVELVKPGHAWRAEPFLRKPL